MVVYNVDAIVRIGTIVVGMDYEHDVDREDFMSNYKLEEWKAAYGVRPIVCQRAWSMIHEKVSEENLSIYNFFWCLYWMKTYHVEHECARAVKSNSKTFREKTKAMARILALHMLKVINWGLRTTATVESEVFTVTVDGTHLVIEGVYVEDRNGVKRPDPKYYSHKHKTAGLTYEVAVAIFSDNIVWINGPFPAGKSDLKIFSEEGLANVLSVYGEKAVGDAGYKSIFVSQKGEGNHEWKKAKSIYRARQESVNSRLKIFRCLQYRWRHDHDLHGYVFRAIALLTQLSFENNPLMESID